MHTLKSDLILFSAGTAAVLGVLGLDATALPDLIMALFA